MRKLNVDAVDAARKSHPSGARLKYNISLPRPPRSDLNTFLFSSILGAASRGLSLIATVSYWKHVITPSGKRMTRVGMQRRNERSSDEKPKIESSSRTRWEVRRRGAHVEKGRVSFRALSLVAHVYCHVFGIAGSLLCRGFNTRRGGHGLVNVRICMFVLEGNESERTSTPSEWICLRYLTRAYPQYRSSRAILASVLHAAPAELQSLLEALGRQRARERMGGIEQYEALTFLAT
jgi:hypothetical protein